MDGKLVVFKHSTIFEMTGEGPNNDGSQNDYGNGPVLITTDVGCTNANSVATTPVGIVFKSAKGIYLLDRSGGAQYIGGPVEAYNSKTITSANLISTINQVRFTTSEDTMLVYDYFAQQWSTFTGLAALDATNWNDSYVVLRTDGYALQETSGIWTDNGAFVKLNLTTSWLALAGIQNFQRVWRTLILGSYKGPHVINLQFGYDYNPAFTQTASFDGYAVVGSSPTYVPYQFRVHLTQQKCEAIRINIYDTQSAPYNEGFDISSLNLEVGVKQAAYKLPPANTGGNV